MTKSSSRLWRALRDLGFAMINATLILIALCLFLGLRLTARIDSLTTTFSQNLISAEPLRTDILGLTAEFASVRTELSDLRSQSAALTTGAAVAMTAKIDALDARIGTAQSRVDGVIAQVLSVDLDPTEMLENAARVAVDEFATQIAGIGNCTLPGQAVKPSPVPAGN